MFCIDTALPEKTFANCGIYFFGLKEGFSLPLRIKNRSVNLLGVRGEVAVIMQIMSLPSSPCSDEDWARKASLGDHAAFAELVRKYSDRFYGVAYRLLRNGDEAEEIVQSAYLKFWQDPKKFNPQKNAKFSTWFYRVVVNACLDRLGKRGREVSQEGFETPPDAAPSVESKMAERERQHALNKALGELPEKQRAALTLCFWEGLTNQEAADVLGLRLKALQSLLVRAKENLKAALRPEWRLIPS